VTVAFRRSFSSDPTGTRLASTRAGNAIGSGDWSEDHLLADIMQAALEGRTVQVRNPDAIRPWQHLLNPLSGYLVLDSTRARARLGWLPPVGLVEALESIVDWHMRLPDGADMRAVTLGQIEAFQQAG
jgi:nucleoside-diphosphate-sugar epimerase